VPVCCERGSRVEFFWQLMVSASDAFALAGCLPLIIATLCLVLGIRATVWGFIRWLWPPVDSAGRCGAPGAPGGRAEGLDPLRSVGPCLPEGSCPTSPAASTPLRLQPRPAKRTAATPLQCRLPAAASPHSRVGALPTFAVGALALLFVRAAAHHADTHCLLGPHRQCNCGSPSRRPGAAQVMRIHVKKVGRQSNHYCAAATAVSVTAMGSPSLALSHLCCGFCVSDTARRLPAHCETMGVR